MKREIEILRSLYLIGIVVISISIIGDIITKNNYLFAILEGFLLLSLFSISVFFYKTCNWFLHMEEE